MSVQTFLREESEAMFIYNAFQLDCWANSDGSDWSLRKNVLRDKVIGLADQIFEEVDMGNGYEKGSIADRQTRLDYFKKAIITCNHLKHELAVAEKVVHESKTGKKISEYCWNTWAECVNKEVALLIGVQKKESKELQDLKEPTESENVLQEEVV